MSKRRRVECAESNEQCAFSAGVSGELKRSILLPLKWENDVLKRLLFNARNAHRRKPYWVQTRFAAVLVERLLISLDNWDPTDRSGALASELRQSVELTLLNVEEAARRQRESLIVFGFFLNLAETTFAILAREVKLLTEFKRIYLDAGGKHEVVSLVAAGGVASKCLGHSRKKLRSKDALTAFLERIEEQT
eukprot:Gregarina_sp_Poly_1__10845@NODE_83_length_15529_cov_95_045531_g71_i0_p7_GENE_NODE_83_length_15529_cov_95_045531_g71_i0NODE_83_length_15529_cov_95_045531_g71_i0_p7_ORF_typecomplete_len192_score35_98DUF4477/PF14780_6/0_77DUF4477/PF14780_6/6_8e03SAS6_N/PF16531_5/0_33_NODE_83_length_15529_cov_95_045531_g71_i063276902